MAHTNQKAAGCHYRLFSGQVVHWEDQFAGSIQTFSSRVGEQLVVGALRTCSDRLPKNNRVFREWPQ